VGLPERGFGLLLTVFAVGGLVGTVLAPWVRRRLGTSGIVALVLAIQAGAMLLTGLVWNIATISLRQRIVPDVLLGRVTSAYRWSGSVRCPSARQLAAWSRGRSGCRPPSSSPAPPPRSGCSQHFAGCHGPSWRRPRRCPLHRQWGRKAANATTRRRSHR